MITTKTSDRLTRYAHELSAIAEAVYEADRDIAREIAAAAGLVSAAAHVLEERLTRYQNIVEDSA